MYIYHSRSIAQIPTRELIQMWKSTLKLHKARPESELGQGSPASQEQAAQQEVSSR